jgi:hypothetical protein
MTNEFGAGSVRTCRQFNENFRLQPDPCLRCTRSTVEGSAVTPASRFWTNCLVTGLQHLTVIAARRSACSTLQVRMIVGFDISANQFHILDLKAALVELPFGFCRQRQDAGQMAVRICGQRLRP